MKQSSLKLIDEPAILVLPSLAVHIGFEDAVALQQLHFLLKISKNIRDGRKWVYNSYPEWKKHFPWWSERTIQRIFIRLVRSGIVIVGNYNKSKLDRTNWYSINYDHSILKNSNEPGSGDDHANLASSSVQTDLLEKNRLELSIPETTKKHSNITTTKTGLLLNKKENHSALSQRLQVLISSAERLTNGKVTLSSELVSEFVNEYGEEKVFEVIEIVVLTHSDPGSRSIKYPSRYLNSILSGKSPLEKPCGYKSGTCINPIQTNNSQYRICPSCKKEVLAEFFIQPEGDESSSCMACLRQPIPELVKKEIDNFLRR